MNLNIWKIGTIIIACLLLIGVGIFLSRFIGSGQSQQISQTSNQQIQSTNSTLESLTTPAPKRTPDPSAENALKSLRRMASATQVGLNFQEYGTRVVDLKADVDEEVRKLPEGQVKQEIKLAMEAYADASTAWNEMLRYDFMLTDFEPARTFQKKYSIPATKSSVGGLTMQKEVVLSTIWGAARKHIERASELNK